MELGTPNVFELDSFLTLTLGIIVLFAGITVTKKIGFLQRYNIPEPVTGGIVASLLGLLAFVTFGLQLDFDLFVRDVLLIYFFTTIGINARFSQLLAGGKPLLLLLVLTLIYLAIQDAVGYLAATALGQPSGVGVLVG
ncbi:MAG: hypothetical protein KJP27_01680, partial [Altererythrobacter sp.]|nr:hypothetical protein [Altererythrobacter sp.]